MILGTELEVVDDAGAELVVSSEDEQAEIASRIAEVSAEIAALVSEAASIESEPLAGLSDGTALVPSTGTAKVAKRQLAGMRAEAARAQARVEGKRELIRERQAEIKSLMERQMELAEVALAPLQKFVARLEEGIWMVNLYLGRDEEIVTLLDGEPAPADEVVVIRQLVLAMDEECAVNPDEGGIDATNIEEFDEWLKASRAHVEQVAPEPKCIVALRPRWHSKQYEDPWKQAAVAEEDRKTYFLIRNGDRLFRTWTEFNAGQRLVPKADEFASYFFATERRWGRGEPDIRVPITPGTPAWERAEEAADAQQRHYMRVGLILQGIVDRTTVLHPLPEAGISFMDHEQGGVTWRFLSNAERAIGTGRQPFYEWLAERNRERRVGMRIVGSFKRWYRSEDDPYKRTVWPRGAERPPSGELLTIEEKTADGFTVRYPRTERIYDPKLWVPNPDRPGWGHYGDYKTPKLRASCVLDPDQRNYLPFDLVTVEEMEVYLQARLDRHAYAEMIPLLKQAIRAKRAEAEVEAPFRTMLSGVLARDNGVSVEDAVEALDGLIGWWKLTNKNHRPLVGDEEAQAKAVRMIVAEHARRLKTERKGVSKAIVERLRLDPCHEHALAIGRRRDGRYVVIAPHFHDHIDVQPYVWLANFTARGQYRGTDEWRLLTKAQVSAIEIAWQSEAFEGLELGASAKDHLSGPEFDSLAEQVLAERGERAMAVAYDPEDHEFHTWRVGDDAQVDSARPITGRLVDVVVEHVERKWQDAGKHGKLLRSEYRSHRGVHMGQAKPWDTRRGPDYFNKDGVTVNRYVVLFEDPERDAHRQAETDRYEEAVKLHRQAIGRYSAWLDSIEKQWVERKERAEFDRFLEDYLDPELWEGHRKTLDRDLFAYPYSHWRSGTFEKRDALGWLVTWAVETGVDLDGLTVWEAASGHFPPVSYTGVSDEVIEVIDGERSRKRKGRAPSPDDIPEDLRELRFVAPEPDDEEDEDEWIEDPDD